MSFIHYRPATLEDLPTLLRFEQGIITAERPYDTSLKPDPISYYDLKSKINSNHSMVVVAESKAGLVGSGFAEIKANKSYLTPAQFAYLGFMFVVPESRGLGIVQGIIEYLKNWADHKGITEIKLEVYHDNHAAMKAYEKAGFKNNLTEMRLSLRNDSDSLK